MIYHRVVRHGRPAFEEFGTFNDLPEAVALAHTTLKRHRDEFDGIAVQGSSGMALGFPLKCLMPEKEIVVIRKPGEDSHCSGEVITGKSTKGLRVIFVDDFVSCGSTRTRVREAVEAEGGTLVAQYTSREDAWQSL